MKPLILSVAFLLLAASTALAQGPPGGTGPPDGTGPPNGTGHPDDTGPPTHVDDTSHGFAFRPTDLESQRPAFSYDAGQARMHVQENGTDVLDVLVDSVSEFHDDNGDGAYQVGESIVQRFELDALPSHVVTDGASIRDAVYVLDPSGELRIRFYADPEGTATKFDIIITDFPFQNDTSLVAVTLRAVGIAGMRSSVLDGQPGIHVEGDGERPFMSWTDEVLVDGAPSTVHSSVQLDAEGGGAVVTWSYGHGDIVHDPLIGVTVIPLQTLGETTPYLVALGGSVALVTIGFIARRSRPW